jgi:outer membrane protein with beta-barrel domain
VNGLLRRRILIAPFLALALFLASPARRPLHADPPVILTIPGETGASSDPPPPEIATASEPGSDNAVPMPSSLQHHEQPFAQAPKEYDAGPPDEVQEMPESNSYFSKLKWLGLRHSSTDGRNAGMGIPLTGTSWLNRPYYLGGDIGTVWLTRPINSNLTTDVDTFGGIFAGCDWDYYWGTELAINRATPEIVNEQSRDSPRGDRMMQQTISLMYYPWGDALFRPYWRWGIGATEIDYPTGNYPTASDFRRDEMLWTFPIGIGLKYPLRRFLATRIELTDAIALGNEGVATQHDITLTLGLEWRFGAHPRSYWPWNPSRHIW